MTRTVYKSVGSRRFSAPPKRLSRNAAISLGSFDALIAKLDAARTRLKTARRATRR